MASHPIPGDKGAVNSFSVLSEQNWQVIQNILGSDASIDDDSWDNQLLLKLRTLYVSCMDEAKLDYLGQAPLQQFVNNIRKIYRGKRVDVNSLNPRMGLSNALGYMHSRGKLYFISHHITLCTSLPQASMPYLSFMLTGMPAWILMI
jgi:endothelin-converting enzyme